MLARFYNYVEKENVWPQRVLMLALDMLIIFGVVYSYYKGSVTMRGVSVESGEFFYYMYFFVSGAVLIPGLWFGTIGTKGKK